jgi:hypothetical protein
MLDNDYDWTCYVPKRDTAHLSDEEIKEMINKLTAAVQVICYEYGIHN